jgi:hypothetical protein
MIKKAGTNSDIEWTWQFLSQISPRSQKLIINDDFMEDECHWFRAAIENEVLIVRHCISQCPRLRKRKESGPDEFVVNNGKGLIRHLFSLSTPPNPITFNREYLPHIAAYARLVLDFGYDIKKSSFSLYRTFQQDLIFKKKGGSYETDAEFYDSRGNLYLHVEVKKTAAETVKLVDGVNRKGNFSELSTQHAKELEYVLDLKPTYLWIVGPGSVEPAKYIYKVTVDGLNAIFAPCDRLPEFPY